LAVAVISAEGVEPTAASIIVDEFACVRPAAGALAVAGWIIAAFSGDACGWPEPARV
jgi:hypothetical protein